MSIAPRSIARARAARAVGHAAARWLPVAGAAAVAVLVPRLASRAERTLTLDVDGRRRVVTTSAATVRLALAEHGLSVAPGDRLDPALGAPVVDGARIVLRRAPTVTVVADGRTFRLRGRPPSAAAALAAAGVALGPRDLVTVNARPWSPAAALPVAPGPTGAPQAPDRRHDAPVEAMFRGVFMPGVAHAEALGRDGRPAPDGPAPGTGPQRATPRGAAERAIAPALAALGRAPRVTAPVGGDVVRVVRARAIEVVDGGVATTVVAAGETLGQALAQAGVAVRPGDRVSPGLDTPLAYAPRVTLQRAVAFALDADGMSRELRARSATLGEALAEAGVGLFGRDIVDPPAETPLAPGLRAVVTRVRDVITTREVEIPYRTEATPDPDRPLDDVVVLQAGVPGLAQQRVEVTTHGGRVVGRRVLDEVVVREPVAERVSYGTGITWGTVMTEAGPLRYWRKLRVYATSYSAARAGTPRSAPWYGRTRIGEVMRKGIVATDPRVIPMRTNLYVEGYGVGFAGDTGGGVKRLHIDLGYDDDNYISWHRYVDVYLLEPAPPPDRIPWTRP